MGGHNTFEVLWLEGSSSHKVEDYFQIMGNKSDWGSTVAEGHTAVENMLSSKRRKRAYVCC